MKEQRCIICDNYLNDGIMISGRGICKRCEDRIIHAKTGTDFYEYYKRCIKKNIAYNILRGEDYNCLSYPLRKEY